MSGASTFENLQIELKDSLERLKCVEVVQASSRHGDMRFLCRMADEPAWLSVLSQLLHGTQNSAWYTFIGKKYFLSGDKLVFGWVLIWESDDEDTEKMVIGLRKVLNNIALSVTNVKPITSGPRKASADPAPAPKKEPVEELVPKPWSNGHYDALSAKRSKKIPIR